MIDAECSKERGGNVFRLNQVMLGAGGFFIALADHLTTLNRSAAHQHEHAARIMIASAFGRFCINFWSSSKLTRNINGRSLKQSLFGQTVKQARQTSVESGKQVRRKFAKIIVVGIPTTKRNGYELDTRFD